MLLSQRERIFDENVMKAWRKVDKILPRLQQLSPELFQDNCHPQTIGVSVVIGTDSDNYEQSLTLWGFDAPVNINGSRFILEHTDYESNSIDVSSLIIGAKEGSFVVYKNMLTPSDEIYRKKHFHRKAKKEYTDPTLFLLNGDVVRMRGIIKACETKAKSGGIGIGWRHITHDGLAKSFNSETDIDFMIDYYKHLCKCLIDYKSPTD